MKKIHSQHTYIHTHVRRHTLSEYTLLVYMYVCMYVVFALTLPVQGCPCSCVYVWNRCRHAGSAKEWSYIHTYRQCVCMYVYVQEATYNGPTGRVETEGGEVACCKASQHTQSNERTSKRANQTDDYDANVIVSLAPSVHYHAKTHLTQHIHTYIHSHVQSQHKSNRQYIYEIQYHVSHACIQHGKTGATQYKQYTITHCTALYCFICLLHSFINKHSVSRLLIACVLFHLPTTYDNQQLPDSCADAADDIVIDAVLLMLHSHIQQAVSCCDVSGGRSVLWHCDDDSHLSTTTIRD